LTAGHVVSNSINNLVYATAEKAFQKAVEAIYVSINDEKRKPFGGLATSVGNVRVDHRNDFERVDSGLIRVFDERAADNRLSKLPAFEIFDFVGDGD